MITFVTSSGVGAGGTIGSIGLSMPVAFDVANSPITTSGTFEVTGAGTASQYIRGDGQLATYNAGSGGGGSSQVFYFNGGVPTDVVGYEEMSKTANLGTSTDFNRSTNGYIASFLTSVGVPNQLSIPAGNWTFQIYMSASSNGGNPRFYVELYKYNGATFSLIASSSANPEGITNGTTVDLYSTDLAVPTTSLLATDRLAVRVFVFVASRTITMHTQDSNLSDVITTFSNNISSLNALTTNNQYLAVSTTGTDFTIGSVGGDTHTFNLPTASATNRGALSSADWSAFNNKVPYTGATGAVNLGAYNLTVNSLTVGLGANAVSTNTAIGVGSLRTASATSSNLTAFGYQALYNAANTTLGTAIGSQALLTATANQNTAIGYKASNSLTTGLNTGNSNIAIGNYVLQFNLIGLQNTAIGTYALNLNTSDFSTAIGEECLKVNTSGNLHSSVGSRSLFSNTTGSNNTAIGRYAGDAASVFANTTGSNNIFIGYNSVGVSATASNRTWIGNSSTTSTFFYGRLLVGTTTDANYTMDILGNSRIQDQLYMSNYTVEQIVIGTNTLIIRNTTPNDLIIIGLYASAQGDKTAANSMVAIGNSAGYSTTSGGRYSVYLGRSAGYGITTGQSNIIIASCDVNVSGLSSITDTAINIVTGSYEGNNGVASMPNPATRYSFIGGGFNSVAYVNDFYFGAAARAKNPESANLNFYAPSGNGTNLVGANFTINAGRGTGTGIGGDFIIATSIATTSGTTLQTSTSRWFVKGETGKLSNVTSPNASAIMQIDSTTLGFLPPRMTTTQKNAIVSPQTGLMVYDSSLNKLCVFTSIVWETITSV